MMLPIFDISRIKSNILQQSVDRGTTLFNTISLLASFRNNNDQKPPEIKQTNTGTDAQIRLNEPLDLSNPKVFAVVFCGGSNQVRDFIWNQYTHRNPSSDAFFIDSIQNILVGSNDGLLVKDYITASPDMVDQTVKMNVDDNDLMWIRWNHRDLPFEEFIKSPELDSEILFTPSFLQDKIWFGLDDGRSYYRPVDGTWINTNPKASVESVWIDLMIFDLNEEYDNIQFICTEFEIYDERIHPKAFELAETLLPFEAFLREGDNDYCWIPIQYLEFDPEHEYKPHEITYGTWPMPDDAAKDGAREMKKPLPEGEYIFDRYWLEELQSLVSVDVL